MVNSFPQVVTIAGSDSDGSAGAQADLKTFQARKVYGMSILTAAVAGNSYGIYDSVTMPANFIDSQFATMAKDFKVRAFKTGMLANSGMILTVIKNLKKYRFPNFILDPVIITKHGDLLLEDSAYQTLVAQLLPMALLITPNFFEAQKLADMEIIDNDDIKTAAHKLQNLGVKNVLIKGKHDADHQTATDYVLMADGSDFWLTEKTVNTKHINGTGDTLSACITAELAKGKSLATSIKIAKKYTHNAIMNEIDVGHKYGPINHLV